MLKVSTFLATPLRFSTMKLLTVFTAASISPFRSKPSRSNGGLTRSQTALAAATTGWVAIPSSPCASYNRCAVWYRLVASRASTQAPRKAGMTTARMTAVVSRQAASPALLPTRRSSH